MVQACVVRGCGSTWCPGGDIKFHAFPKNNTQRELWLSIVPLKRKFYESARICNLHFHESDYDSTRRLKQTAVPTKIINQEVVSSCELLSSSHEVSKVQIDALAVPSSSSGTYENYSSHKETGVKHAGCNVKDQTSEKIPANEERRDLWIKAMKLKTNVSKSVFVCGHHFTDHDYSYKPNSTLKPDAVPSIISPMIKNIIPVIRNIIPGSNTIEVGVSDSDNSMESDTANEGRSEPSGYQDEAVNSGEDFGIVDDSVMLVDTGTQTEKIPSPETEKLRHDIQILRERLRRYEVKIVNLKTILDVVLKKRKRKITRS